MPKQQTPSDRAEYELWCKAVSTEGKCVIPGVSAKKKCALKSQFCVCAATGKLLDRETRKETVTLSDMDAHLKSLHDDAGHPGRDAVYQALIRVYSNVPHTAVKDYIANCVICRYIRAIS